MAFNILWNRFAYSNGGSGYDNYVIPHTAYAPSGIGVTASDIVNGGCYVTGGVGFGSLTPTQQAALPPVPWFKTVYSRPHEDGSPTQYGWQCGVLVPAGITAAIHTFVVYYTP